MMADNQDFEPETLVSGEDAQEQAKKQAAENDPRQGLPESVRVETATGPTTLQQADPTAKGPWIQYNGVGTVRAITDADWAAVGVTNGQYREWNYLNHKRIPVSKFSDEELQYLLRCDGRFSLVEE